MTTQTRFHHRPTPRTAYLLGRPATTWVDALSRSEGHASRHNEKAPTRHEG